MLSFYPPAVRSGQEDERDTGMRTLLLRAGAECIGTFLLVAVTYGAMIMSATPGMASLTTALFFGGSLAVLIGVLGRFSGAHLNPTVTLFFALIRHLEWCDVPVYLAGQLLGAIASAWLFHTLFGPSLILDTSFLQGNPFVSLGMGTGTTLVFLLVVFLFASDERPRRPVGLTGSFAALAVGIAASLCTLSGTLINPAQVLGLVLILGGENALFVSLCIPFLGTVVAVALYWVLHRFGSSSSKAPIHDPSPLPRSAVSYTLTPQDIEGCIAELSALSRDQEKLSVQVPASRLPVALSTLPFIFCGTATRSVYIFWIDKLSARVCSLCICGNNVSSIDYFLSQEFFEREMLD